MQWIGIDELQKLILHGRDKINMNNLSRTLYYKEYFKKHPEVPWAFLAHLVSRNAGYQMSDSHRFYLMARSAVFTKRDAKAIFSFLEAGNFLILRDVLPPLEMYRWAKKFPSKANEIFSLLDDPEFDIDPFIKNEWKNFFPVAIKNNGASKWVNDWSAGSEIQRHSFALIVNEQNQIQDRLVNDPKGRYTEPHLPSIKITNFIDFLGGLGMTRLCFPLSTSLSEIEAKELLIYVVRDFDTLNGRIETGRDLFVGLLNPSDSETSLLIQRWALDDAHYHSGSRTDYNPAQYTFSKLGLVFEDTYSPSLKYKSIGPPKYKNTYAKPAWPYYIKSSPIYKYIHETPVPLPKGAEQQVGTDKLKEWLSPLVKPKESIIRKSVYEKFEIIA